MPRSQNDPTTIRAGHQKYLVVELFPHRSFRLPAFHIFKTHYTVRYHVDRANASAGSSLPSHTPLTVHSFIAVKPDGVQVRP
jgi:hypothetical protein